ncbi:uncharacterized protein LOC134281911 [Saccostrea cucullata]|uniref:uncharacterized protein LOC134281911 n=1 Tax=Saccostrea cuccullata TaxID=36930 RepID=UPI002ED32681
MIFKITLLKVYVWMVCVLQCLCSVTDRKLEACYGDGWRLQPVCGFEEVVYPYQVLLGAKDPNICPAVLHKNQTNSTLTDQCCQIDQSNTCGGLLNVSNYRTYRDYFENCIGRVQCTYLPIERTRSSTFSSTCDPQFHENTTLVTMIYQCVKDVKNIFNTEIITNRTDIHLKGQEYGNPILQRNSDCDSVDDVIQCSVEALSCDDVIDVQAWDYRLECGQELWFCDSNETVKLTCDNNTGIQKTDVYHSLSNYVTVTFKNSLSRDGGYFWLTFNPVPVNSTLTVSCPVRKSTCPGSSGCQAVRSRSCRPSDNDDDKTLLIIAGVVGCVILLILIILIVIKWKHRQKKIDPDIETTKKNPYVGQNGNELQTASRKRRPNNRLSPIPPTNQRIEREGTGKPKKGKKRKKDKGKDVPSTPREVTTTPKGRKEKKKKKDRELNGSLSREASKMSEGRKSKRKKRKKHKDVSRGSESNGN